MFNIGRSNFLKKNTNIRDYCLQSTSNSIKRIIEKKQLEEKIINETLIEKLSKNFKSNSEVDSITNANIFNICFFLSVSSFIYFYSNRK
jgi:hypothetical protein